MDRGSGSVTIWETLAKVLTHLISVSSLATWRCFCWKVRTTRGLDPSPAPAPRALVQCLTLWGRGEACALKCACWLRCVKEARHKRTNAVRFHLREVSIQIHKPGSRTAVSRDWGPRREDPCFMGTESLFGVMNILEMESSDGCTML